MWIRDSGTLSYNTNNESGFYDITDINKSMQGSSCTMPTTKKKKRCMKVWQVDESENSCIMFCEVCANVTTSC